MLLAEATRELGGRVTRESGLPGLGTWARVRDWRLGKIERRVVVQSDINYRIDETLSVDRIIRQ